MLRHILGTVVMHKWLYRSPPAVEGRGQPANASGSDPRQECPFLAATITTSRNINANYVAANYVILLDHIISMWGIIGVLFEPGR